MFIFGVELNRGLMVTHHLYACAFHCSLSRMVNTVYFSSKWYFCIIPMHFGKDEVWLNVIRRGILFLHATSGKTKSVPQSRFKFCKKI